MGGGCSAGFVQGLHELRLDCSSDVANFSDVGSKILTLAELQSSCLTSVFHEHRIALSSMVETSHVMKPLSALFQF